MDTPDQMGTGETIGSVGITPDQLLNLANGTDQTQDQQQHIAPQQVQQTPETETITNADGTNAYSMRCKLCGCAVLPKSCVRIVDEPTALPPMPVPRGGPSQKPPSAGAELVQCFWRVTDKFTFDNMGVTRPLPDGIRYIVCAECDQGPIGWFRDETEMRVAVDRVAYA